MEMTFKNITELNTYINTHSVNLENIDIDNYIINSNDSNDSNNFITFRSAPRNYTLFISLEENSYHKISEDKSHIIEMYIPQIFTIKVTATISEIIDIRDNYDVKYLEFIDLDEEMSLPDTIIYSGDDYEVETEHADIMNWGAKLANLNHAWSRGFTGKGVKVGIIDGNFVDIDKDPNIPIKEKIVFATRTEGFYLHHGTSSASSICSPLNGINNVGTAPECDLYALNMDFTYPPIMEALNWCLVNKMDVLVLNYGSDSLPRNTEANLITAINDMGTIIVVPSHNFTEWEHHWPASHPDVICVSGVRKITNEVEKDSSVINWDDTDVLFPSSLVKVTNEYGNLVNYSGTSVAGPSMGGYIACLKQEFPDYGKEEMLQHIKQYSSMLPNTYGVFPYYYNPINPPEPGVIARITSEGDLLLKGSLIENNYGDTNTMFTVTGDLKTRTTTTYDGITEASFTETEVRARNIIENAL